MTRDIIVALMAYQELHDRMSKIIEDGRFLTMEPAEYRWLVDKLASIPEVTFDMNDVRPQGSRIAMYDENGQEAFIVVTKRRGDGVPKLEKALDEKFYWTEGEAEARLGQLNAGMQAHFEVRGVRVHFVPRDPIRGVDDIAKVVIAHGTNPCGEIPLGDPQPCLLGLDDLRRIEAERVYQDGHPDYFLWAAFPKVEEADGWEVAGEIFRRTVYVEYEPEDDLDRSTRPMILTIVFKDDSSEVDSVEFKPK